MQLLAAIEGPVHKLGTLGWNHPRSMMLMSSLMLTMLLHVSPMVIQG